MNPKDKVVVITGASSGIGEALALDYAAHGAKVAVLARRLEKLVKLSDRIESGGGRALALECDIRDQKAQDDAFREIAKVFGKIDVVVVNAGYSVPGRFESLSVEDYRNQFETNVFGALMTAKSALPYLKETQGRLAIVGSVMSYFSIVGTSAYSMSKYAVRSMAESLWGELRPYGIKVTLISPGFVDSEIRHLGRDGKYDPRSKDDAPAWLVMPAVKAARIIRKAIQSGKREQIVTGHAHLLIWMARHTPWIYSLAAVLGVKRKRGMD